MQLPELQNHLPLEWGPMDLKTEFFKIVPVPPSSQEHSDILLRMHGSYYSSITGIYKLQNPYLYTRFAMTIFDYKQRGPYRVLSLFHDTSRGYVESIARNNFDWRFASRFKYGLGVHFSTLPHLANRHSSKHSWSVSLRSMFIIDVVVQNVQKVNGNIFLPDFGYDTVLAHKGETYIKYYDCEYYPRYIVDYVGVQ